MTNFSSSYRVYLAATFAIIMIAVASISIFVLYSERKSMTNKADNHAVEDTRTRDMLKIAKFANEEKETISKISSKFISATDTVAIIEEIESMETTTGTSVEIRSAEKIKSEAGTYLSISTQVLGDWNNVYKFITLVDNLIYKHEINKILLTEHHEEKMPNSWRLEMEIKVYLVQ